VRRWGFQLALAALAVALAVVCSAGMPSYVDGPTANLGYIRPSAPQGYEPCRSAGIIFSDGAEKTNSSLRSARLALVGSVPETSVMSPAGNVVSARPTTRGGIQRSRTGVQQSRVRAGAGRVRSSSQWNGKYLDFLAMVASDAQPYAVQPSHPRNLTELILFDLSSAIYLADCNFRL